LKQFPRVTIFPGPQAFQSLQKTGNFEDIGMLPFIPAWQARLADYKAQVAAAEVRHWIDVIVLKGSMCCIYLSILVTF